MSVLREVMNPEPVEGLKQRVMMRMVETAAQASELQKIVLFDGGSKEEGVFRSLWNGLLEVVSPSMLPPLMLESRPVAVVDQMGGVRSYRSAAWAVVAHVFAILVIGYAATTGHLIRLRR